MSRWTPPWMLNGLGYNPRQYSDLLNREAVQMRWWQNRGVRTARDKMVRLPRAVMETLYRRLRRWTWYRDIGGQRYYLLYRGVTPAELAAAGGDGVGSPVTFQYRASYTPDPMTANQFARKYGTKAVGVWVPESAIVTAPFALGKEVNRDYAHGEIEIIVDPYTGILQDPQVLFRDFCVEGATSGCTYRGWMGIESHPWTQEWDRRKAEFDRRMAAGKDVSQFTTITLNPNFYRTLPPTPDSKTSRGF